MPRYYFFKLETVDGEPEADDHFVIQPTYNRDDDGPVVVQEVLISKYDDKSLPSGEDDAFIVDGADQTAGAHTGGCQPVFYDGSVRLIGTSDAIATSDFLGLGARRAAELRFQPGRSLRLPPEADTEAVVRRHHRKRPGFREGRGARGHRLRDGTKGRGTRRYSIMPQTRRVVYSPTT